MFLAVSNYTVHHLRPTTLISINIKSMRRIHIYCIIQCNELVLWFYNHVYAPIYWVNAPSIYFKQSQKYCQSTMWRQYRFSKCDCCQLIRWSLRWNPIHSIKTSISWRQCLFNKLSVASPLRTGNTLWNITSIKLVPFFWHGLTITFC